MEDRRLWRHLCTRSSWFHCVRTRFLIMESAGFTWRSHKTGNQLLDLLTQSQHTTVRTVGEIFQLIGLVGSGFPKTSKNTFIAWTEPFRDAIIVDCVGILRCLSFHAHYESCTTTSHIFMTPLLRLELWHTTLADVLGRKFAQCV